MARASKMVLLLALVFAAASLQSSRAEDYDVGGDFEWRVPTNDPNFYSKWASNITFLVGDTLEFEFTTGAHDVATVTKAAYDACTTANPISLSTTGPATIRLNTTGEHYYICTISNHCSNGQKLAINVTGTTSSPPSTGTTPSPPGTSGTPSAPTPTSNTSAPPPPSSASSLTATIFLVFTSVAVAFLC